MVNYSMLLDVGAIGLVLVVVEHPLRQMGLAVAVKVVLVSDEQQHRKDVVNRVA